MSADRYKKSDAIYAAQRRGEELIELKVEWEQYEATERASRTQEVVLKGAILPHELFLLPPQPGDRIVHIQIELRKARGSHASTSFVVEWTPADIEALQTYTTITIDPVSRIWKIKMKDVWALDHRFMQAKFSYERPAPDRAV